MAEQQKAMDLSVVLLRRLPESAGPDSAPVLILQRADAGSGHVLLETDYGGLIDLILEHDTVICWPDPGRKGA